MTLCQKCGADVSEEWEYCFECGARIIEPSLAFMYDQLFEVLKLEEQRREHLDSKASTYIGLLSIAVTIIVSSGLLTIKDFKSHQLIASNITLLIIAVLYVLTVLFFIIGVLYAFRAYHTGSKIVKGEIDNLMLKNVFLFMDVDWLVKNSDKRLSSVQKELINHIHKIFSLNYPLNNQKSNNILYAYRFTFFAIILLLLLFITILVGAY